MTRLRRAARVDANQADLVREFRGLGGLWVPAGHPIDAWCGWRGRWLAVEVKDGNKPPSRQKLTDDQIDFIRTCAACRLPVAVVRTLDDLLAAFTDQ